MLQSKMQKKIISIVIGIALASVVVLQLHNYMIVDACLDIGGKYDDEKNVCVSGETYEEYFIVLSWVVFAIYIIVGVIVSAVLAFFSNKALNILGRNNAAT